MPYRRLTNIIGSVICTPTAADETQKQFPNRSLILAVQWVKLDSSKGGGIFNKFHQAHDLGIGHSICTAADRAFYDCGVNDFALPDLTTIGVASTLPVKPFSIPPKVLSTPSGYCPALRKSPPKSSPSKTAS